MQTDKRRELMALWHRIYVKGGEEWFKRAI